MIKEKFEQAARFHGHRCPGLAIGVRTAEEAKRILGIKEPGEKGITCMAESSACFIDGIQLLCGCTVGNGRLKFHLTGKTAFNFYTETGESVRLRLRTFEGEMTKEERIAHILTAPFEELYETGEPAVAWPAYVPTKRESGKCAVCGETADLNMLKEKGGKLICVDCLTKNEKEKKPAP